MKKFTSLIIVLIFLCGFMGATTWYVRPAGGDYGAEDGTSYADAWDGLENIVWGGAGVVSGDTLYICGCHLWVYTGGGVYQTITVSASGSSGNRIVIRGDYVSEAGEVWFGYSIEHEIWVDEGSNTYSITLPTTHYADWYFEDVSLGSYTLLTKATDLVNCKATSGSHYSATYDTGTKLYIHCSDDGDPTGRIVCNRFGYRFNMDGQSYITFQNLKFYAEYRSLFDRTGDHSVEHLRLDGCRYWYGTTTSIFEIREGMDYFELIDCNIGYAPNGPAWGENTPGGDSPGYGLVQNCTIHDMGNTSTTSNGDSHAVSFQGSHDGIIEGNNCYNCGHTIVGYAYLNTEITNWKIRKNFVHSSHTAYGVASPQGIALNGNNDLDGDLSGNEIYENIVSGFTDCGIRDKWPDNVNIYNNVVYNCRDSYHLISGSGGQEVNATVKNNISFSPTRYHIYYRTPAVPGGYILISDYNCFNPSSGDQFYLDDSAGASAYTLAEWQALVKAGCTFDPNSITGDPAFVNGNGDYSADTDFQIPTGSPCKDAGVNVGLGTCYFGVTIPSGPLPDIGAHEYDQGDTPHKTILKSGVKLIITPGGKIIIKEPLFELIPWLNPIGGLT